MHHWIDTSHFVPESHYEDHGQVDYAITGCCYMTKLSAFIKAALCNRTKRGSCRYLKFSSVESVKYVFNISLRCLASVPPEIILIAKLYSLGKLLLRLNPYRDLRSYYIRNINITVHWCMGKHTCLLIHICL